MLNDKRTWIIAAYIFTAIYLLPMFPHGGSANELTRWATVASIVEKGSFEISWTEPLIGPNVDTAKVGDKTYSNKAPGPALVSIPFYALTRVFIGPPDASNIRISWFVMRFAVSTLPLLLLAVWMFRRGADEFALAALLFATPLFLYSLLFFSHVMAAVAVYTAFRFCFDAEKGGPKHLAIAGFLSGLAVISEFPTVFAVAVLGVGLLLKNKADRVKPVLYFVLGGLPFGIFLLIYNNALFGSPFSMSYAHESFPEWAEVAGQGFFGIGVPTPANIYLLLISPSRGLLFTSSVLVLSLIAFWKKFDRGNVRNMVRLAATVVGFLIICGHGAAHGGWAFGPRYLVFIIPFLLDPFIERETDDFSPMVKGGLLAASILLCVVPSLTFPFAPPEFSFPHNQMWMRYLGSEGWFVPNLANVFGAPSAAWTLVPVAACVALVIYVCATVDGRLKQFLTGTAAAAAIFVVYLSLPLDQPELAFRRASIAERYFRPANRLDEYASKPISEDVAALNPRAMQWNVADTRAYAPDDFPYLPRQPLAPSPTALMKSAVQFQKQQKLKEAEDTLKQGEERFPFAKCEFATNLAVIYFTTNQKDAALGKLESVQPMVSAGSLPDCLRSQFLLGSLYRELGHESDSNAAFQKFLANSATSKDAGIQNFRKQLQAK